MADSHPAFSLPAQKLDLLSGEVFASHHGGGAVVFFHSITRNQALFAQPFGHRSAWIGCWMLYVRPIDITLGEMQVGLDRFSRVRRIPDNQSANHIHLISMNVFDGFDRRVTHTVTLRRVFLM